MLRRMPSTEPGTLLLSVAPGRLDASRADTLKDAFSAEVTAAARIPERVILDLAEVTSVDSAGLGALIGILKRCRRFGSALTLRHVPPEVRALLDLTLVGRIFEIEDAAVPV